VFPRRLVLVTALCAGLSLGAWAQGARGPAPQAADPSDLQSAAERAQRQEIRAHLIPLRYTTLAAEIGARVRRLPFGEAQAFKAGDLLVALDCSVQQAQREKARAELAGAQAALEANQRLSRLNAISELELVLAGTAAQRAQAEIGAHDALIEKCALMAPFNGRVAEQKVREQQFVQPGQALLDILDDSSLELEFLAPSSWLRWLREGQTLRVSIDETRRTYPARFTRIGARVDPVSQSVKVAATIDGRFSELMPGMSGRVLVVPPRP
jgi:membrane fusion protein (multidrug efflux system)